MRTIAGIGLVCFAMGTLAGAASAEDRQALKTKKDKTSYSLGVDLGNSLRKRAIELDAAVFERGLKDGLAGAKQLLTDEEVRSTIRDLQLEQRNRQLEQEKKDVAAFLESNKDKPGVVTLASGLQYKVVKAGSGRKPTPDDKVLCHYRATLLNGTEVASTYNKQPVTVPIKGTVQAWAEALQLMPAGSKWQLVAPANLLRPKAGVDAVENAGMMFELELLSIEEKK